PAAPARPAPHLRPCPAHPGLGCLPGPVRVVFPHLALTPRPAAPPRALAHPLGAPHRGGVRGGVEPEALAVLDRRQSLRLPLKPSPSRGPSGSPVSGGSTGPAAHRPPGAGPGPSTPWRGPEPGLDRARGR